MKKGKKAVISQMSGVIYVLNQDAYLGAIFEVGQQDLFHIDSQYFFNKD